ncbi:MAG: leucine--tRNA ligase [Fidelibacterota bacterium]
MSKKYPHHEVESKWRDRWERENLHSTDMDNVHNKLYCLVMFIYPSGDRLHIGHWYNFGPTDSWARFKRMQGFNVFEPIGYDAFGLPAENYAIKRGIHPAVSTAENIAYIRKQLKEIGAMYDWRSEIDTSSPEYYKWTQWLFLKLFEMGLAYRKKAPVNWCPNCATVLANEQVLEGKCERCETTVTKKELEQWFFKITDFADELLKGLEALDWPEKTKIMQINWIGKSEGAEIKFPIAGKDDGLKIPVFTTRPDTLFGATYLVLAPEHPMVRELTTSDRIEEVNRYVERSESISEVERTAADREKTGVFLGSYALNPANNELIPVWIADYVLYTYGTGAIMAVPAHDERDFEFAKKFDLPIRQVILPPDGNSLIDKLEKAYTEHGIMVNSLKYNGLDSEIGKLRIVEDLEKKGLAEKKVYYKLHDWLISRQRYWGAPIPIIYCGNCGTVPVHKEDLPVLLPGNVNLKDYIGMGISPLAMAEKFLNTICPECGGEAKREVDTMDTFVCSSWYFLRYVNVHYDKGPWDPERVKKWLPVDKYVGGAEHATMHLLYARFVIKALCKAGVIHFDEPFLSLTHQGVITNQGAKMSKSKGNVVNPDDFIKKYGSDTFRMYLMFMGPYDEGADWSDKGIIGIYRFINRVWRFVNNHKIDISKGSLIKDVRLERIMHYTIKRVTEDLENFKFNTAISRIMEYVNSLYKSTNVTKENLENLLLLLAPFSPHLSEELWERTGHKGSIFNEKWPSYNDDMIRHERITIIVQINGKVRGKFEISPDAGEKELLSKAKSIENVNKYLKDKNLIKSIVVPGRIINFVVN